MNLLKIEQGSVIIAEYKKLLASFDNTNDMFKDVYVSFMNEYQQESIDSFKRDRAKHAKTKLIE